MAACVAVIYLPGFHALRQCGWMLRCALTKLPEPILLAIIEALGKRDRVLPSAFGPDSYRACEGAKALTRCCASAGRACVDMQSPAARPVSGLCDRQRAPSHDIQGLPQHLPRAASVQICYKHTLLCTKLLGPLWRSIRVRPGSTLHACKP